MGKAKAGGRGEGRRRARKGKENNGERVEEEKEWRSTAGREVKGL